MSNGPVHDHADQDDDETEAAIIAGGEVVGTAEDGDPLVEGPNSK
ncbi:MAG TPA: hypothetical protein VGC84_02800 [Ilumatobacteraceae bacterium]|jgi:hypothetical protein